MLCLHPVKKEATYSIEKMSKMFTTARIKFRKKNYFSLTVSLFLADI